MKIALDISQAAYQGTGVGRYVADLTRALLKANSSHQFFLYANTIRQKNFFQKFESELNHKIHLFPLPPKLAPYLSSLPLPIDIFINQPDLLHTSDWTEPSTRCPRVTTVHDLIFRLYPATVDPKVLRAQKLRLDKIVKTKTHIIADSKSTKRDLLKLYQLPSSRIDVVYPGISPIYKPPSNKLVVQVKTKYHLSNPYLLSVGTQEPRKNLNLVLAAYQVLRHQRGWENLNLVLVGRFGWGEKLPVTKGVISLGFVPDEDLPALYSAASVFVYPSLYEGFGYPVLEAMACGAPVVTSNVSSLPEVAGDAAILVDPKDKLDLVAGIIAARINKDKLIDAGYRQAKKFTWDNAAQKLIKIYEKVAYENRA